MALLHRRRRLIGEQLIGLGLSLGVDPAVLRIGAGLQPFASDRRFDLGLLIGPALGAALLARFDDLTRHLLTAKHIGRITPDDAERILSLSGRAVRGTFQAAMGYRYKGVQRADVELQTAVWGEAQKLMGDVPADVLSGQRRARFAPDVASRTHTPSPSGRPRSRRARFDTPPPGAGE